MTSETDHPRQRTVAELLAQHGDGATTGRRRRRRAADGPDDVEPQGYPPAGPAPQNYAPRRAAPPAPPASEYGASNGYPANGYGANGHSANGHSANGRSANGYSSNGYGPSDLGSSEYEPNGRPPVVPDRSVLREPVPRELPDEPPRRSREGGRRAAPDVAPQPLSGRTPVQPVRDEPTEQIPRFRGDAPPPNGHAVPPRRPEPPPARLQDSGSNTLVGVPPRGAEAWHESRTSRRRGADDGGPPTQAAARPLDLDDRPAGLDDDDDVAVDDRRARRYPEYDDDVDYDDEYEDDDYDDEYDEDGEEADDRPAGRRDRIAATLGGQGWPAVVAQWVIGAVGGATLWVLFRFLWRDLPVVAIAAAVLVTVGLVVVVRNLLRSNDMRTTVFAVLVGLLLTVSPVILILLGR